MEPAKIKGNLGKTTKFTPELFPSQAISPFFHLLNPKKEIGYFKLLAFRATWVLNQIMDYWGRPESDSVSTGPSKTEAAAPVKEEKPQEEEANINVGNFFYQVDDYKNAFLIIILLVYQSKFIF